MLKKTIKYVDFNDVERTEEHYFNLTKAELAEMELSVDGGFAEMAQRIANIQDGPSLIKVFKDLILKSYGEKSADGRKFLKLDEKGNPLSIGFSQTAAYSALFMELANDVTAASEFFTGVIPAEFREQAKATIAEAN